MLLSFFPSYLEVLLSKQFKNQIKSIHIEGYTSPEGGYVTNLILSQCRAKSVAALLMKETTLSSDNLKWLQTHLSVDGHSYSKVLKKKGCTQAGNVCVDYRRSRRVTFRVRTIAEEKIVKILEALKRHGR